MKLAQSQWAACGAALTLTLMTLSTGCNDSDTDRRGPAQSSARGGLFDAVAANLNELEQYETDQILKQTCDRLNQWYLQEEPTLSWQPDPLLEQLDSELRNQPEVSKLGGTRFEAPDDGWYLQENVWLRDVSKQARADQFEDVAVGKQLFDWTIRNIQLEPDSSGANDERLRHRPFEILLLGRGTALERAWVFALLARQQGLNVVMLGLSNSAGDEVRPWLPALVTDGQLYLFDTRLGIPIPGQQPDSIATLDEVVKRPELLRKLDLDEMHSYPVAADDLKQVVAFVEASPPALSKRMALVESRLSGNSTMKLSSPGSALAEQVSKLPHVAEARLWPMPFEVYLAKARRTQQQNAAALKEMVIFQAVPTLRLGRSLHFKGQLEGDEGAKTKYLNSRPPDEYIVGYRLPPELAARYPRESIPKIEAAQSLLMREAKQDASYWLGLVFLEQQDYPNAIEFLANRTLGTERKTPWASAARFNLAQAYEKSGNLEKAIELYESDTDGPQSHGNRLRARWLKESAANPAAAAVEPKEDQPAPADKDEAKPAERSDEPETEQKEEAAASEPVPR